MRDSTTGRPMARRRLTWRHLTAALAALAAAAVLAACGPTTADWNDAGARKTNEVQLVSLSYPVRFPVGEARLPAREQDRLDGFLARQAVGYGDRVYVLTTDGAAEGLAAERRASVIRHLARSGIMTLKAAKAPDGREVERGAVTLLVRRYVAIPPKCGDWSKPPASDFSNTVSSNFGCATEANLGVMVADPGELLVGRPPGAMDGTRAVRVIEDYRAGKTEPLPDLSTSTISSGGASGGATQ